MNKRNITFVISHITNPGGTERGMINWANTLLNHGYTIDVISLYTKNGDPYYHFIKPVKIQHLGMKLSPNAVIRLLYGFSYTLIKLKKYLRKKDIVIGLQHNNNVVLALLKKMGSKQLMIGCEQIAINEAPKHSIAFKKKLYKYLDALIVLTEHDKALVQKEYDVKKCFVIPNQLSFFPEQSADCSKKEMLAVGRFDYQKGFDLLIELVNKPLKSNPDWRLTIIGDESAISNLELKTKVKKRMEELELESQVTLLPSTPNILPHFLNSSLYLLSSRFEGMPLVLLEAKACGLPIVAYDCPTGPKELVEQNDGVLVPLYDTQAYEDALMDMINNTEKRIEMGKNARINVQKYSAETIYKKWEDLFNTLT
jgi:glycosyltransferase involved in cell wall biosynthesis